MIRLSRRAELDLAEIWTYVASDSVSRADALIGELARRPEPATVHPDIGQIEFDALGVS